MTTTGTDLAQPARRASQTTMIEQSRAVAEVQAAIVVAQQCPRDPIAARERMREACRQPQLAARAFFRFSRGGSNVSGPSVHLARELARCWGNLQYGLKELRRDDTAGESEMLAYAWDVETNSRSELSFIVKHLRDKRGGPERLTDLRDIYENNANNGARRLREVIFAILPQDYVQEAQDVCTATIANGGGKPLGARIADALAAMETLGVSREQVEAKLNRTADRFTAHDVAQLGVVFTSIQRSETSVSEEFPGNEPEAAIRAPRARQKPAAVTGPVVVPDGYDPTADADWPMDGAEAAAEGL